MTGYRRPGKTYRLRFEDPSMAGLEVTMRGLSTGALLDLTELAEGLMAETGIVAENAAAARKLFEAFAERLISWNLEDDDGQPVPATYDGITGQDFAFVLDLVMAWMTAVASVPPPLPGNSPAGVTPQEESLQLASSSASLPN